MTTSMPARRNWSAKASNSRNAEACTVDPPFGTCPKSDAVWKALLAAVCGLNPNRAGRTMSTAAALCGSGAVATDCGMAPNYTRRGRPPSRCADCPLTGHVSFIKVTAQQPAYNPKRSPGCRMLRLGPILQINATAFGLIWGGYLAGFNRQFLLGASGRGARNEHAG